MSNQNGSKINQILQNWNPETVGVNSWFEANGVSRDLLKRYVSSGWIKRIGKGAYIRTGDKVEWTGALYAIQQHLALPVHTGGKSALKLHGMVHYLTFGSGEDIELYGQPNLKLPEWFKNYNWGVQIRYFSTNLFNNEIGIEEKETDHLTIKISSAERAIMEVLYHVPESESFDEADKIMEGLFNLRPDIVFELLKSCNSIKVKRLFLYLAEKNNSGWLNDLDLSQVDLGSGKRSIIKNGYLDGKYNITVPKQEFYDEQI